MTDNDSPNDAPANDSVVPLDTFLHLHCRYHEILAELESFKATRAVANLSEPDPRPFTRTDFLTIVATSTFLTALAIVALTHWGVI